MAKLVAILSLLGMIAVLASMFRGLQYRWMGVINLRNIFLLGYAYFQLYGAIYPLWTGDTRPYQVLHLEETAIRFALLSALFLLSFYGAYALVFRRVMTKSPVLQFRGTQPQGVLLTLAVVLAIVAYLGRFSGFVPIIGPLLNHALLGSAAAAAGLAAAVAIRNYGNPILLLPALLTIGISLINTITSDFGRRGLVGILGACLWCAYFTRSVEFSSRTVWLKLAPAMLVSLLLVGAFSQIRGEADIRGNAAARTEAITNNIGTEAFLSNFRIPDTGIVSLWLIDSRIDAFEPEGFFAVQYFFYHMVPRVLMPDKPDPLSLRIPVEANRKGVALGIHTVGPGVVGHAAADGGWYAAIFYGLILGGVIGGMDRLIAQNMHAPLAIAAMGCALGQMLGLSRGDSSIFLGIILLATFSNVLLFYVLDRTLGAQQPVYAAAPA